MGALSDEARLRIAEALREDIGAGDWTTVWCVDPDARGLGEIAAKSEGVIAGLDVAAEVYAQLGGAELRASLEDGDEVAPGTIVATVSGTARAILTGERSALNFLGRLSGVATLTRRFVLAVEGTGARITDTRKTTPLWRELERSATRAGGAVNHRRGLDTMVLIKENHLTCAGGIEEATRRVRKANQAGLRVEVETTNLGEVELAVAAGVDRIMLDNMTVANVRGAVRLIRERAPGLEVEVSGGITLSTVRQFADAGADFISVGALTHSAPALDLSLRIREVSR